ncbi:cytochrome P450 2B4-like [Glandiceps talaboti]
MSFGVIYSTLQKWLDLRSVLLTVIVFLISYWIFNRFTNKRRNLPPGPRGLPLLGNVFALANATPFSTLRDMATIYGDVFTVRLGTQLVVVLNSYDAIRQALVEKADDFVGRPNFDVKIGTLDDGVVLSNGTKWKFKRRLFLSYLRTFGMGKASMERRILEESQYLLQAFENHNGRALDPMEHMNNTIYNVICSIVVGERFEYEDPRFKQCMGGLESMFKLAQIYTGLVFMFPGAGIFMDLLFGKANLRHNQSLYDVIEPFIKEHDDTFDPDNIRDFTDVFLKTTKDWEKEISETSPPVNRVKGLPFHYYYVYSLILDMFAAGTETTNTTLMWGWLFMLKYPDIQKKVQEELDRVVGKDRPPNMSDRVNLPYTEATITEVLRLASTVPLSVPRWTVNDTQVYGYDIPKDTMIWPNIWSALRDPELWENPEQFNPERFIDSEGKFSRPDIYIPFGLGPRVCLGEQLAKMELFLVFSCVLQNFTLLVDDEFPLPDMRGTMHLTLQAPNYKMVTVKR